MSVFKKYQPRHRNLAVQVTPLNAASVVEELKALGAEKVKITKRDGLTFKSGDAFNNVLKVKPGQWIIQSKLGYFFVLDNEDFVKSFAPVGGKLG